VRCHVFVSTRIGWLDGEARAEGRGCSRAHQGLARCSTDDSDDDDDEKDDDDLLELVGDTVHVLSELNVLLGDAVDRVGLELHLDRVVDVLPFGMVVLLHHTSRKNDDR